MSSHTILRLERLPRDLRLTFQLIYRERFDSVVRGWGDKQDIHALMSMIENVHIAMERKGLGKHEGIFEELRQAYKYLRYAELKNRNALTGEGLSLVRDILELHESLLENSSAGAITYIVTLCNKRANSNTFRCAT